MSIVFIMPNRDSSEVAAHVRHLASIPVHEHGQEMSPLEREAVRLAVLWHPPPHSAAEYPGLEAVMSYGAGVEFIMSDDTLPQTLLRGRLVDDHLKIQMARYLLAVVLSADCRLDRYRLNQAEQHWQPDESAVAATVGILGHGQLSRFSGQLFQQLGYRVNYWRRTQDDRSNGIYSGPDGLNSVAAEADVLICLLPLTSETRGVLSAGLFSQCKPGCHLINVGRGGHLVVDELIDALDTGQLSAATLDVFDKEPLPSEHPLWQHAAIRITPHVASKTSPISAARRIIENYHSLQSGQGLLDPVDSTTGY